MTRGDNFRVGHLLRRLPPSMGLIAVDRFSLLNRHHSRHPKQGSSPHSLRRRQMSMQPVLSVRAATAPRYGVGESYTALARMPSRVGNDSRASVNEPSRSRATIVTCESRRLRLRHPRLVTFSLHFRACSTSV